MKAFSASSGLVLVAAMAACATVGLIWLPIGHAMIGIIEEWDMVSLFHDNGVFFVTSANSPLPHLQIRPLNIAPQAIAYVLGPNSFLTWHLVLAFSLVGKVLAMTAIAHWLLRDRWIAVATGLLFMLYPADTMQMTLRAMHIDCAVAFSVAGLALVLGATDAQRPWQRWLFAVLGSAAFVVGSLIYETGLFLAPAPLMLWWARHGSLRGLGRQLTPVAVWTAFVALNVGYIAVVSRQGGLYEQGVSQSSIPLTTLLAERLPELFTVGMYREFLDCWYDAARALAVNSPFWPYLSLLVAILLACLWVLKRPTIPIERLRLGRLTRTIVAGFVVACMGYLPYLSSASHVLITQRTHLFSAVGGALAVAAVLQALCSRPALLSLGCWTVVLSLALGMQWVQLDHYTRLSLRERMLLAGIAQAAPDLTRNEHVLIIDQSGQLESTWMMRGELLMRALSYMYNYRVFPTVCVQPGLVWADFASDAQGRPGRCVEQSSVWDIGVGVPGTFTLPKQDLITLTVTPDGAVRRDSRTPAPASTPAEVRRWRGILGCWPAQACHYTPPLRPSYRFDWGTWWSLEEAPWGAGWRDANWDPPAWAPRSYALMNAAESRLWIPLQPADRPYRFRLRLYAWVSDKAKASLRISINGRQINYRWKDADTVTATIDPADLVAGLNDLTFAAELDPASGISLAFDWVQLDPNKGSAAAARG